MARDRKKAKARRARQERQQRSGGSRSDARTPRPEDKSPETDPAGGAAPGFDPDVEADLEPASPSYDRSGPLGRASGDAELAREAEEGLPTDDVDDVADG